MVTTAPGPVLGYVTHGTNAGAPWDYILNSLKFTPAPGAAFVSYESYNAYTFISGVSSPCNQGLVAQWIQKGGTAATGNVWEPESSAQTVTREDRLFQMLLNGYSWVEAAWNATAQLSYVNTVVGDPLMTYRPWLTGDCNDDGSVDVADYQIVMGGYGETDLRADLNGDGRVDLADYVIWIQNYGQRTPPDSAAVPEPATLSLLALGALAIGRRRKR